VADSGVMLHAPLITQKLPSELDPDSANNACRLVKVLLPLLGVSFARGPILLYQADAAQCT